MLAIRVLEERPIVGGEKFSALIGPSRLFRRLTALALASALAVVAAAVLASAGGFPGRGSVGAALALFALSVASAWLSGGPEELVCQGGVVRHRRAGALADRGRVVRLDDVRAVREPAGPGLAGTPGVALETPDGIIRVGRRLAFEDARWLAEALRGHLRAAGAIGRTAAERPASAPVPHRSAPPDALARIRTRR